MSNFIKLESMLFKMYNKPQLKNQITKILSIHYIQ